MVRFFGRISGKGIGNLDEDGHLRDERSIVKHNAGALAQSTLFLLAFTLMVQW
jgi:hypothetical protein